MYSDNNDENEGNRHASKKKKIKEKPFYFSDDELKNVPGNIKELLTCSIKQGIIHYPVISPFGFTNEKESIECWLEQKKTCPLTKKDLYPNELILNQSIFNLIKFYVLKERYNKANSDRILDSEIID